MSEDDKSIDRRGLLKNVAATGTVVGLPGIATAREAGKGKRTHKQEGVSRSMKLTSENSASEQELEEFILEIAREKDKAAAAQVAPKKATEVLQKNGYLDDEITAQQQKPDLTNVHYVDTWTDKEDLMDYTGAKKADVYWSTSVYKTTERDPSGYANYFIWHFAQAEGNNDWWQGEGKIRKLTHDINVDDYYVNVDSFSPDSIHSVNNKTVSVGLSVNWAGFGGAGVNGSFEVNGEVGPMTDVMEQGWSGRMGYKFDGCTPGQSINGVTLLRSLKSFDELSDGMFTWNYSAKSTIRDLCL